MKLCQCRQVKTLIVGSGAAGLAAADYLYQMGERDLLILTEGLALGTSRNTGSDKQTYYKVSQAGEGADSVTQMARTLFSGGAVDGDLALIEAANSTRAFYHLVELGVDFPYNEYGEYVGYQTDHDLCKRGTSIGPLTSKRMVECLIDSVQGKHIPVLEHHQAIRLLTQGEGEETRAVGVLTLDCQKTAQGEDAFLAIQAQHIIWATGGEAGMYRDSVYPTAQKGGMAPALRAGARGKNLTESQYGLASTAFRWNVSGTYQQCIPRYVSVDEEGREHEFLTQAFLNPAQMVTAIFLKGYQWPFDPRKLGDYGSSLIDVLVYREVYEKHRRVYMDFTKNTSNIQTDGAMIWDHVTGEAREYLDNCQAHQDTPIARLAQMNPDAIALYRDHNIDLETEYLEISVCAQHNNGGLAGDMWWESNLKGLYPVGEVNGSHGIYRPGGSALNAGQAGALRVAQAIVGKKTDTVQSLDDFYAQQSEHMTQTIVQGMATLDRSGPIFDPNREMMELGTRMSRYGSVFRSEAGVSIALEENRHQVQELETVQLKNGAELPQYYRIQGLLFSQETYLRAILDYIQAGGDSRGSYLIMKEGGDQVLEMLQGAPRYTLAQEKGTDDVQEITYCPQSGEHQITWRKVRPIPESDQWFERVWRKHRER